MNLKVKLFKTINILARRQSKLGPNQLLKDIKIKYTGEKSELILACSIQNNQTLETNSLSCKINYILS